MRHVLLPIALALLPATATADRIGPPPPAKKQTAAERIRELEQRVVDLERELAAARAQLAKNAPAPAPSRLTLDQTQRYPVPLDDSPAMGPTRAPITIVAALQFPEPYTHKAWPTLMQILRQNRDVRLVVKSYIVHPRHARSSIAACAAGLQGELDKMEPQLYEASRSPDPSTGQTMGMREVPDGEAREIARALRLDLRQYDRDIPLCEAAQKRDVAMFTALGQRAVPVFWINGRPLSGAQAIESFNVLIREERETWRKAKARGVRVEDHYAQITGQKPNP